MHIQQLVPESLSTDDTEAVAKMQLSKIWYNTNEAQQAHITVVLDVLLMNVPLADTEWS